MAGKVTIRVIKGSSEAKDFCYTEKETLVLGRRKACSISFAEKTVSRYHCLLDVAPPNVMVRDFGSKNGTWLNGKMIGQRPRDMTPEEAQRQRFNEFTIADGDTLSLGPDCMITFHTESLPECAYCGAALTMHDPIKDAKGNLICEECLLKQREAALKREEAEKAASRRQGEPAAPESRAAGRRCEGCGAPLLEGVDSGNLCENCRKDPYRIVERLMERAEIGEEDSVGLHGFETIELLGEGGMAQVWLVEEVETGRQLALKVMLPRMASEKRKRDLFLREATLLGQLSHKNIVQHTATGGFGETFFILMEYCEGGSLDKYLKRMGGKLEIDEATDIITQVLDGLAYAHKASISLQNRSGERVGARGIVHRDLKPGNIFIKEEQGKSVYKVADFGLAKAFESNGLTGHTMTGKYCGTFWYMPRCQILNCHYSKPSVDIWAAVATYYEMLTGRPAREFSLWEDYARTVLSRPPVPIRMRNENIPKPLAEVIDTFLSDYDECEECPVTALDMKKSIREALQR